MRKRFNIFFRIQHILMFASVSTLVITAIPLWCLRYPQYERAMGIIDFFGGLEIIRKIHHTAGWTLTFAFLYHLLYVLLHPEGRRDFVLMMPTKKDFKDVYHNLLYFVGKRKEPPLFGRFSYFEKFDYWAAYWGCVIMISTGLFMMYSTKFNPILQNRWLGIIFDISVEAHYHEAILAALALFIWHIFNVHLNPKKFPGSMVWLNGNIKEEEYQKNHPLEENELENHKKLFE